MLSKIIQFFLKFPKITLSFSLAFCLFFTFFSKNLSVDASAQSLLLEHDEDLKFYREISSRYGGDDFLMLAFTPKDVDLFSQKNLNFIKNISEEFAQIKGVKQVFSIANAPLLQSFNDKDLKEIIKNIPNIFSQDINITLAKKEILNHPFYKNNLISKDGKTAGILIYLEPDLTYNALIQSRDEAKNEKEKEHFRVLIKDHQELMREFSKARLDKINNIVDKYSKNDDFLHLGGVEMIANDMISYVKSDLVVYGLSLIGLLFIVLWWFFGSLYWVFLALGICIISLFTSSGIFALLGFDITIVSSNYVALVLIITVSVVIHLIVHFIENLQKHSKSSVYKILLSTLLAKANPSFYAILTTIVGFLSFIFSDIEPIIKLGIMMSLGIALSLILAYVFFASVVVLLPRMKTKKLDQNSLKFLQFCANASLNHRKIIYFISVVCVVFALFGISKIRVENSFVDYFKDSSRIKQGLLVIDKELGGTMPLDVIVKFKNTQNSTTLDEFEKEFEDLAQDDRYFFSSDKTRIAAKVHNFLASQNFVGSVLSLQSLLELGKNINDGKPLDDFVLAFLYENLETSFKNQILTPYVSIKNDELRFSIRVLDSNPNLRRDEFIKKLQHDLQILLQNDNVEVKISGIMLLYNNLLQNLFASQFDTLVFVIFVIFVLFVLIFRSFFYAFVAILANIIPLTLVFGLMGWLGISLDIMSITIAAICIGIGVDDMIHYIHRLKEELKHKKLKEAIIASHLGIGSAIYYTSFAIILGFLVMVSSNFIPTIYFGLLTVLAMSLLLFGSLFLLPSLIITFSKKNKS
ncbi:RND family transporter [Campylobacter volucris]|uniref:RND family transporter n=1 Tax=Campylobacter volucris TaxID=1031542 RepID=A0AAE5YG21_9BACT|nr:MMPL family transporter [Campylobacter volucris]AJC94553.1 RND superfamily exporter [Campylobacter volucris LMG 24379]KAB0578135.1 RND family transporter [Campylobacter volucris]QBL13095.1 RND family transporter [Campylobacter volucris]QEL08770.1 RND superfamily transporter [Campylobacter volucris]TXK71422.1 RND family transporter [Campylobacter volucris]